MYLPSPATAYCFANAGVERYQEQPAKRHRITINPTHPEAGDPHAQILALVQQLQETERRLQALVADTARTELAPAGESSLLSEAREHIRRNDSLFRMAGRAARLGAWSLEVRGRGVVWSDEVCAIHDVPQGAHPSLEEAIAFYTPDSREAVREAVAGCIAGGGPFEFEAALVTAKGRRIWVRALGEAVRGPDGTTIGLQGAFQDITLHKESEETLRSNEVALHTLASTQASILNALPANIALLDGSGVILSVNESWSRYAAGGGQPQSRSVIGQNYLEVCDRAAGDGAEGARQTATGIRGVLSGESVKFEMEYPCHSPGRRQWFRLVVTPLANRPQAGAVVMHLETTAEKLADDATRVSEERFRSLFRAAGTGIAISLPNGRFIQVNAAYCRMLGYTEEELLTLNFAEITHPDDLPQNLRLRDELLAGKRDNFLMEKRYRRKDGTIVWARHSVAAVRKAGGEVATLIVIAEDITESRQAAEGLAKSERRFKAVFEQAAVGVAQVDALSRRYVHVNQRFSEIVGRSRPELERLSAANITHAADYQPNEAKFQQLLSGELREFNLEKRYLRGDGAAVWAHVTYSAMWAPGEPPDHFIAIVQDITERRRMDARYRRLIDSDVQGVIFWNTKGEVLDANDFFLRLTGYSRQDLKAGLISWMAMTPPEFTPLDVRALEQLAERGVCEPYEKQWVRKDGTRVPILLGSALFEDRKDEGVCFVLDLTERSRADEALRASERRFKALFEQAAVGVAQVDATTGKYLHFNRRFSEILGRSMEELANLTSAEVVKSQTTNGDLQLGRRVFAGVDREFTVEERYLHKDGTEVWANVTVSEMWAPGEKPDFYMTIVQDITARKKLEEQFRQAQKMEAMGTLAGGIAHDFNNILSSINGYTELARLKLVGNPEVRDYLGAVLKAGQRAAALVRQILSFSRRETLERAPIQLRAVVAECVDLLRATIPATVDIATSLAGDAPIVLADATQIHQVLMNLGTNAWHAMKGGSGEIRFRLERFPVDAVLAATQPRLRPGDYARISVTDTGGGMDQRTLQRIFEPFFTTKPQGEGTGLGLSVVHGIMESHDGAISVYSQPGEGTVFYLYFPALPGQEAGASRPPVGPVPRGNGERILLVDDEELLATMAWEALQSLGYLVESTTKPADALEKIRRDPAHFDLMVTDQTMPGMTGLALAEAVRLIRPGLPIILMTGYSGTIRPDRIEAAGIRQLIQKPVSLHALGTAVHDVLSPPA